MCTPTHKYIPIFNCAYLLIERLCKYEAAHMKCFLCASLPLWRFFCASKDFLVLIVWNAGQFRLLLLVLVVVLYSTCHVFLVRCGDPLLFLELWRFCSSWFDLNYNLQLVSLGWVLKVRNVSEFKSFAWLSTESVLFSYHSFVRFGIIINDYFLQDNVQCSWVPHISSELKIWCGYWIISVMVSYI